MHESIRNIRLRDRDNVDLNKAFFLFCVLLFYFQNDSDVSFNMALETAENILSLCHKWLWLQSIRTFLQKLLLDLRDCIIF